MKLSVKILFSVPVFISVFSGWAEDEGDGETADFSFRYNSSRYKKMMTSSVGYSRYFIEDLYASFSTSLRGEFDSFESRTIESRTLSSQMRYDPASPWYLNVSYINAKSYNYRPPAPEVDEYKALTVSNSLTSSLGYTYAEDLRTYLDISLGNSTQESIVAGSENPDTYSEYKSIRLRTDYDLTASTVLNGSYEGGVNKREFVGSDKWRTDPPTPPKVGRTLTHRLGGSISSNNELTESIYTDVRLDANAAADEDELLWALNNDSLSGSASCNVTFTPATEFTLKYETSLSRFKNYYPFKKEYEDVFGTAIFDSLNRSWNNRVQVTLRPSPQVSSDISYDRSFNAQRRYDDQGLPPNPDLYPEAIGAVYDNTNDTVRSSVDVAVGDDLTFHLTYYLSATEADYLLDITRNTESITNNLSSNISYDFTERVRADVRTNLNINKYAWEDKSKQGGNNDSSAVTLGNSFTYKVSDITKLMVGYSISADRTEYDYDRERNAEIFDRSIEGSINNDLSELFDFTLTTRLGTTLNNYPYNSLNNRLRRSFVLTPRVITDISEALTFNTSFTFQRDVEWYPDREDWVQTWLQRDNYNTSFQITYRILEDFNLNISAVNNHQVEIEDKNLRKKEHPNESYFNVTATATYQW